MERYEVGVAYSGITFSLNFMKISLLAQKLKRGENTEYSNLISLLFSEIREGGLKMKAVYAIIINYVRISKFCVKYDEYDVTNLMVQPSWVRQGCSLSSCLFDLCINVVINYMRKDNVIILERMLQYQSSHLTL
jgi:hypothetical protein